MKEVNEKNRQDRIRQVREHEKEAAKQMLQAQTEKKERERIKQQEE